METWQRIRNVIWEIEKWRVKEKGREEGRTMTNIIQDAKALPMMAILTPCIQRPMRTQPLSKRERYKEGGM